ncbi:MAG: hypothetical protein GY820_19910 [Gammaproteobacteria bacterium]|nr:hypothetical protein [Gammaproteobacteria bacterium]
MWYHLERDRHSDTKTMSSSSLEHRDRCDFRLRPRLCESAEVRLHFDLSLKAEKRYFFVNSDAGSFSSSSQNRQCAFSRPQTRKNAIFPAKMAQNSDFCDGRKCRLLRAAEIHYTHPDALQRTAGRTHGRTGN